MARESRRSPFLDKVRGALRVKHYSIRTEETYLHWIRRFICYHDRRHPADMGETEVAEFLTHLAVRGKVAASTQNQALNALVFLYKHVLDRPLGDISGVVRAKSPQRLPVVLSRDEVRSILDQLDGVTWLVGCLLYGSGLRRWNVFACGSRTWNSRLAVIVRDGKGGKNRVVTLPDELVEPLKSHLKWVRTLHEKNLAAGLGVSASIPVGVCRVSGGYC